MFEYINKKQEKEKLRAERKAEMLRDRAEKAEQAEKGGAKKAKVDGPVNGLAASTTSHT